MLIFSTYYYDQFASLGGAEKETENRSRSAHLAPTTLANTELGNRFFRLNCTAWFVQLLVAVACFFILAPCNQMASPRNRQSLPPHRACRLDRRARFRRYEQCPFPPRHAQRPRAFRPNEECPLR